MLDSNIRFTRRKFMAASAAAAAATALPLAPARAAAKYTRYNVTSPNGQKALASYAKGVEAMLKLPADHPQNWFRNAFIHLMDCPHGNWWFYVWHRGYLGFFEQTIRALSGDETFALPYWDWTQLPQIPDSVFDGVLTPTAAAFEPYTGNLALFTSFIKQPMTTYWNSLSPAQRTQLNTRGYKAFDLMWNDVTGFDPDPNVQAGISGNMAYAITCGARYLSRANPKLDPNTTYDVSLAVILAGLAPTDYYNANVVQSFTSSKTPSHNSPAGSFSVIEGLPHNNVHNCIGGVGPVDPGPYGNMTNFLSPVDPIFFLHHSNIDRLWDVWTRKQQGFGLPILPSGADLKTLSDEPFLFYVDGKGNPIGPNSKAGDYLSTDVFQYDYEPGSGEEVVPKRRVPRSRLPRPRAARAGHRARQRRDARGAARRGSGASRRHAAASAAGGDHPAPPRRPFHHARLRRAGQRARRREAGGARQSLLWRHRRVFRPDDAGHAHADGHDVRGAAAEGAAGIHRDGRGATATLNIRVVPARGQPGPTPTLKAVAVGAS